jgi:hypothetical protein
MSETRMSLSDPRPILVAHDPSNLSVRPTNRQAIAPDARAAAWVADVAGLTESSSPLLSVDTCACTLYARGRPARNLPTYMRSLSIQFTHTDAPLADVHRGTAEIPQNESTTFLLGGGVSPRDRCVIKQPDSISSERLRVSIRVCRRNSWPVRRLCSIVSAADSSSYRAHDGVGPRQRSESVPKPRFAPTSANDRTRARAKGKPPDAAQSHAVPDNRKFIMTSGDSLKFGLGDGEEETQRTTSLIQKGSYTRPSQLLVGSITGSNSWTKHRSAVSCIAVNRVIVTPTDISHRKLAKGGRDSNGIFKTSP